MYSPKPAPSQQRASNNHLLNLLRLQSDRLPIHEDTLALVWLWRSPLANLRRKLRHILFVGALEQENGWLGRANFDALRDRQFDGVRESDLQVHKMLAFVFQCWYRNGGGLDGGPVTDTNHF